MGIEQKKLFLNNQKTKNSKNAFLALKLPFFRQPDSNQVLIVEFMFTTVDTSFIFTKKNNVTKWFLVNKVV